MKNSSVILFVVGLLLLLGLYIYIEDRFTKMEARLKGAESALKTLEPLRSLLAAAPGREPVVDPYLPVQATGPPNAAAEGRDSALAWCPAEEDGSEEWLQLEFAEAVTATAVRVVANYFPGAVVRLAAVAEDGSRTDLWSGPAAGEAAGFSHEIQLAAPVALQRLRLVLDTAAVEGWNEIDAVGLLDADGTVHWAVKAEASSFWSRSAGQSGRNSP